MSLNHLVERLSVKRDYVPPVAQVNDGLGIEAHQKMKAQKEQQQNLILVNRYQVVHERLLKRRQERAGYYLKNRDAVLERLRNYYHANKPRLRKLKNEAYKRWVQKNPEKAKESHKRYREKHAEKVKEWNKKNYEKRKQKENYKEITTKKNKQYRDKVISEIGYEAYRQKEKEKQKKFYDNLSFEKKEIYKAKARERSRINREKKKNEQCV